MKVDLAIFACHGGAGENGKLVTIFEDAGIYSSAGNSLGLGICMDKFLFKCVMKSNKIPVVEGFVIKSDEYNKDKSKILKKVCSLGYPVIIKANSGGSSIGVFPAENETEFCEKVLSAFEFDDSLVIERMLTLPREFNVAVIGTPEDYKVSEVDEPIKKNEILSFADKYLDCAKGKRGRGKLDSNSMAGLEKEFPAKIDLKLRKKLQSTAERVFKILGLTGVVRIDFLYDEKLKKIYVCEVNAIPGSLAFYFFNNNSILINDVTKVLIACAKFNQKHSDNLKLELSPSLFNE